MLRGLGWRESLFFCDDGVEGDVVGFVRETVDELVVVAESDGGCVMIGEVRIIIAFSVAKAVT